MGHTGGTAGARGSIFVNAFVLYLALAVAATGGQASQPLQQPPVHADLSDAEVSELKAKAEKGDASAQYDLGKAYKEGGGVIHSDELAVQWYRKAADQGNADAENDLGIMYRLGQGVPRQGRSGSLVPQSRQAEESAGDVQYGGVLLQRGRGSFRSKHGPRLVSLGPGSGQLGGG